MTKKIFSVGETAKKFGFSERYLRQIFKKQTGKTPKQFEIEQKLNSAAELLLLTSKDIKFIAFSMGFSSQYYFSKMFKLKFGDSPNKYRKSRKN